MRGCKLWLCPGIEERFDLTQKSYYRLSAANQYGITGAILLEYMDPEPIETMYGPNEAKGRKYCTYPKERAGRIYANTITACKARELLPWASRATIYRALAKLVAEGWLAYGERPSPRYKLNDDPFDVYKIPLPFDGIYRDKYMLKKSRWPEDESPSQKDTSGSSDKFGPPSQSGTSASQSDTSQSQKGTLESQNGTSPSQRGTCIDRTLPNRSVQDQTITGHSEGAPSGTARADATSSLSFLKTKPEEDTPETSQTFADKQIERLRKQVKEWSQEREESASISKALSSKGARRAHQAKSHPASNADAVSGQPRSKSATAGNGSATATSNNKNNNATAEATARQPRKRI
jgi:hypothetical protein